MNQYEEVYQELEDGCLRKIGRGSFTRQCSPMERIYIQEKENQMVIYQYIEIESRTHIDKFSVESAVKLLVTKNPVLQLSILKKSGKHWFKLQEEPLFNLEFDRGDVDDIFRKNLQHTFDSTQEALWKIIFTYPIDERVCRNGIILISHHAITDATSNYLLLGYLAKYLAQDQSFINQKATSLPSSMLKPLSISKHLRIPYAVKHWSQMGLSYLRHNFPTKSHILKSLEQQEGDPSLSVRYETLTESGTKILLQKCKANGVSVNSCIGIACCISLIRVCNDKKRSRKKYHHLTVHVPMNCRKYYPETHSEIIGTYTRGINAFIKCRENLDETFWPKVRTLHNDIRHAIETKSWAADTFYPQAVKGLLRENQKLSEAKKPLFHPFHFVLNNMGCIDKFFQLPEESTVKVVTVRRAVSGMRWGFPFALGLDTFQNRIHLKMCYSEVNISTEDVQAIFHCLISILNEIVVNEEF